MASTPPWRACGHARPPRATAATDPASAFVSLHNPGKLKRKPTFNIQYMAHTSLSPHWHLTSQDMRIVRTGNNLPSIFVLERIESDPEYDALKEQLYGMEQYVAMSTSTFMAVC